MDGIVSTANTALNSLDQKKSLFADVASQTLGSNAYSNSQTELLTIATDYSKSTTGHLVANPLTGVEDYVFELRNTWADYATSSSQCYNLYLQRLMYQSTVYDQMSSLKSVSTDISAGTTLSSALSAITSLSGFTSDINSYKGTVYDTMGTIDSAVKYLQIGFAVLFGIFIACSCFMFIGTVGLAFCGCARCRGFNQVGWCTLCWMMMLGFIVTTVLFPVSVMIYEVCDVISLESLRTKNVTLNTNAWDQVKTCLTGTGDLYAKYDLDSKLSFATTVTNNLAIVDSLYDSSSDSLVYNFTALFLTTVCSSGLALTCCY